METLQVLEIIGTFTVSIVALFQFGIQNFVESKKIIKAIRRELKQIYTVFNQINKADTFQGRSKEYMKYSMIRDSRVLRTAVWDVFYHKLSIYNAKTYEEFNNLYSYVFHIKKCLAFIEYISNKKESAADSFTKDEAKLFTMQLLLISNSIESFVNEYKKRKV